MAIAGWGLAPALAAGNTVVLKPAELTPLKIVRIIVWPSRRALPEGVLWIQTGPRSVVGRRFVHPSGRAQGLLHRVDRGRADQSWPAAPKQVKRITLELGGKSANIVFADADVALAAARGNRRRLRQRRAGPPRPLPHSGGAFSAYERVPRGCLEPAVAGVKVGDPTLEETEMGPLISEAHLASVASFVPDDAPGGVARQLSPTGPGNWFAPTVLAPVEPRARAATEEIFGPVVVGHPVRGRGRRRAAGQRHALWTLRFALDALRRARALGRRAVRHGDPVGQLALLGALLDPVRRRQAIGHRAGIRAPTRSRRSAT